MYKVVLDAMGGDNAPAVAIDGAVAALLEVLDLEVTLVGKEEAILSRLEGLSYDKDRLFVVNAREEIEMAESPVKAVRTKTDSSMVVGMRLVAEGKGDAFVTAGSTGATVAGGTLIVRRAKNVLRPALAPVLPSATGSVLLVDCGANVDCKPQFLCQFGIMGSIYMQTVMGVENPRVALINNGAEEEKGDSLTKEAYQLLKKAPINFVGNVEGRDILLGDYDVVVCDGFVGNVLMKFMEGCAKFLMGMLKKELMSSFRTQMGALLSKPAYKRLIKNLDYTEYGGALLLGTNAGVIKTHGSSDANAIKNTVLQAYRFTKSDVAGKIREKLSELEMEQIDE